jgi:hypothetical protein
MRGKKEGGRPAAVLTGIWDERQAETGGIPAPAAVVADRGVRGKQE